MENANSFTITPTNQQIYLDPGQVYEGSITIINPSGATSDFHYQADVTPYSVVGPDYAIDLIDESDYTSISKWIQIPEPTGTVKPNETKELKFIITVPENPPVGGQYATIAISSSEEASPTEGVSVQNIFEIASIIYATVKGDVIEDGEVTDNIIPTFVLSSPVSIGADIINRGNTHEIASFTITATDAMSGRTILPSDQDNGRYNEYVMPGTSRNISHELTDLPTIGAVKVTQTISYSGQTSYAEKTIIICPLWFISLIAIILISIIVSIIILIKNHHRKKSVDII